jgi:hypothetical protein
MFSNDGETLLLRLPSGDVVWWDIMGDRRQRTVRVVNSPIRAWYSVNQDYIWMDSLERRVFRLEKDISATINFACSRLYSDIPTELYLNYAITDDTPTCDQFAAPEISALNGAG